MGGRRVGREGGAGACAAEEVDATTSDGAVTVQPIDSRNSRALLSLSSVVVASSMQGSVLAQADALIQLGFGCKLRQQLRRNVEARDANVRALPICQNIWQLANRARIIGVDLRMQIRL
eukprot:4491787-Pleurochrysis_carterae.AAC.2